MSVTESERFQMQVGLRKVMGDDVANTLMEHLPPSGWSDVARERDLMRIERKLNFMVASTLTAGLALLAIQVQILLSISSL
jgi:hypothetical protein